MTQPVCAYEGCGKVEGHNWHVVNPGMGISGVNHKFQPQPSTVESAPVSQHKPGCPRYSGVGECDCFDDIPASASPQGAGEQWKPDCDIEAMRNALSKLESQVCRNPDLPEAYKTILRDGFKAVGNIELRLKAGAQGAGEPAQTQKCPYGCTMAQYDIRCPKHRPPTPDDQLSAALKNIYAIYGNDLSAFFRDATEASYKRRAQGAGDEEPIECTHGISITEHCPDCPSNSWPKRAQGAVSGPQDETLIKFREYRVWMQEQINWLASKWISEGEHKRAGEMLDLLCTKPRLATPEPHSPHVHNFDANGICVTMGCTPAEGPRKEEHPEDFCADCGRENCVWFAPSPIWNAVMRNGQPEPIICPICFAKRAEAKGFSPVWEFKPEVIENVQQEAQHQTSAPPPSTDEDAECGEEKQGSAQSLSPTSERQQDSSETLSTDERLTEITKFFNVWWIKGNPSADVSKHAADLLRLVVELRQERDEAHKSATLKIIAKLKTWVGRVGHEDYYKSQAKLLELEARAEQAERERDELRQTVKKYSQHIGGCHFWSSGSLDKCTCGLRQRIAVLEGGK